VCMYICMYMRVCVCVCVWVVRVCVQDIIICITHTHLLEVFRGGTATGVDEEAERIRTYKNT